MRQDLEERLRQQVEYYRARAGEYDEWFLRQGRYDHGPEANAQWFGAVDSVREWLAGLGSLGDVLELAAGTGLWTERLVGAATSVHCVDAAPEALDLNHARLGGDPRVSYEVADIFSLAVAREWDTVFMGFWLSHVPDALFESFWTMLAGLLRQGGRVLLVDSLPEPTGTARDQSIDAGGETVRRLNDGRTFRIVKRFHGPAALGERVAELGWRAELHAAGSLLLYGSAVRAR